MSTQLELIPGQMLITKAKAEDFHQKTKQAIYDTGNGLFEYLEAVKMIEGVQKAITEDADFIAYIREELAKNPQGKMLTARGVKFESCEVGIKYDFTHDEAWVRLNREAEEAVRKRKDREEFLKMMKEPCDTIDLKTGEIGRIYPATKTSKSSYKITIAK